MKMSIIIDTISFVIKEVPWSDIEKFNIIPQILRYRYLGVLSMKQIEWLIDLDKDSNRGAVRINAKETKVISGQAITLFLLSLSCINE